MEASLDAVILPGALLYRMFFYLEMPERKDARTSEKLKSTSVDLLYIKVNLWKPINL